MTDYIPVTAWLCRSSQRLRLRRVGPAVLAGHVSQAAADAALAGALQALRVGNVYDVYGYNVVPPG